MLWAMQEVELHIAQICSGVSLVEVYNIDNVINLNN